LPNIVDTDVIESFLSRTTYESLVHKLGHKSPRTTKELLNIVMSHASSKEVVGAIFHLAKGKAKVMRVPVRVPQTTRGRRGTRGATGVP
jgi:hypothetical protein